MSVGKLDLFLPHNPGTTDIRNLHKPLVISLGHLAGTNTTRLRAFPPPHSKLHGVSKGKGKQKKGVRVRKVNTLGQWTIKDLKYNTRQHLKGI